MHAMHYFELDLGVRAGRLALRPQLTHWKEHPGSFAYHQGQQTVQKTKQTSQAFTAFKKCYQFLYDYFEMSSIHGFGHLTARKRHWSEYLVWSLCLILALSGTAYISSAAWRRYQNDPTVISIERDYKMWNTSFPTASICPYNKTDPVKLQLQADKYKVKDPAGFVDFFTQLATASFEDFKDLPDYNEVSPDKFMEILIAAKFTFDYKVSNSFERGNDELELTVSELGVCHVYNSAIAPYFTPENFKKPGWPNKSYEVELTYGSPLDGELFCQIMGMTSGYTLSIIGPNDIPDVGTAKMGADYMTYKSSDISGLSIISSDSVRSLSIKQRKCRYSEESNLDISQKYTYLLCRTQCRLNEAFRLCNCVPHFYKKTKGKPYCDVKGLRCLSEYSDDLTNLRHEKTKDKLMCDCYPLCNDIHFVVDMEGSMTWVATNLKWSMARYPRIRLLREVIFGFSELLVSVGGTAGLFLGCSVLSFTEVIYFFTLRLFIRIYKYFTIRR